MIDGGEVASLSDLSRRFHRDDHLVMHDIRTYLCAPAIVKSVIYGTEPDGLSIARLTSLPSLSWPAQFAAVGLQPTP